MTENEIEDARGASNSNAGLGTCHSCRYYLTGSKELHCLLAPDNPGIEREKLRNGLAGMCKDLVPNAVGKGLAVGQSSD